MQQGIPVITSGSNPEHFREDVDVPYFELSSDEMARLNAMSTSAIS